jgi:hypothetical protein
VFDAWLKRDPNDPINGDTFSHSIILFWERSFYPDNNTIANDLYKKGMSSEAIAELIEDNIVSGLKAKVLLSLT